MRVVYLLLICLPLVQSRTITYKGITEPDHLVYTQGIDRYSYALDRINQKKLPLDKTYYNQTTRGKGVNVYVIDTGINTNCFYDFTCGYNFIHNNTNCTTTAIHATHVGSLIKSKQFGIAHDSTVINLKVLGDDGSGYTHDVIRALDYILENNITCSVVNLSLGGSYSRILNIKVNEVVNAGNKVIVAAGNYARDACNFSPSSAKGAITVGAIDQYDRKAQFSNTGKCVNIYSPGKDIIGASGYSQSRHLSGTSMSAPFIAGIQAIRIQQKGCDAKIRKYKVKKRFKIGYIKDV
jgi:subtilisin family serine protease